MSRPVYELSLALPSLALLPPSPPLPPSLLNVAVAVLITRPEVEPCLEMVFGPFVRGAVSLRVRLPSLSKPFSSASAMAPATVSLSPSDLNPAVLNVQYAVRGELAIKAEVYRDKIKKNPNSHGLPFDKVVTANIGNPQQAGLDQEPLTFGRQVRSPSYASIGADSETFAYLSIAIRLPPCSNTRLSWSPARVFSPQT